MASGPVADEPTGDVRGCPAVADEAVVGTIGDRVERAIERHADTAR